MPDVAAPRRSMAQWLGRLGRSRLPAAVVGCETLAEERCIVFATTPILRVGVAPAPGPSLHRARLAALVLAVVVSGAGGSARALDINGVLPTSIGLPEVNVVLRPSAGAAPYSGVDSFSFPFTNLRLVYDTGASGFIVFEGPAMALAVPEAQFMGTDVIFTDVGVGGSTTFNVSDPTHVSLGNFTQDPPNPYTSDADYPRETPGLRLQLGPPGSAALFLADTSLHGIAGMPAFDGRVSVINPKLAEVSIDELTIEDTIHTYVYDPAVAPEEGPGIVTPDLRVELTMKGFDRFTQTTPAGATGATLNENPFIGPDPLAELEGVTPLPTTPPAIKLTRGGSEVEGTFLLDTGAQISSISTAMALTLGVRYWGPGDPGYDPGSPATLVNDADGSLVPDQFTIDISGIGGTVTIAGFNADAMLVRTLEGDPLVDGDPNHVRFVSAPVYVQDIELMDPVTMDTFIFDGILGTNYLFGSGNLLALSGFPVPFRAGPFELLVLDFDAPTPTLGLVLAPAVPISFVVPVASAVLIAFAGFRRLRSRQGRRAARGLRLKRADLARHPTRPRARRGRTTDRTSS